jgi:hypothetical protein
MRTYARVLRSGGFGRLWLGASVSLMGDGMTFLALSWLVIDRGGTGQLGLLGVCFTAPVILGGLAVGPLLDRVDKRTLLLCDSLFRAACVASVPLAAALGEVPTVLPFVVAGVYGLLKMVPLAGFPAAIPQLVKEPDLDAANALESLSFSVATVVGPAAAGVLVGMIGAPNVLLIDAVTYLVFAGTAATLRTPLPPPQRSRPAAGGPPRPRRSLKAVGRDRVIVATTVAFMLFNVAEGMLLLVVGPWLVKNELTGGAASLGLLIAAMAAGEFIGAALAGVGAADRAVPGRRCPVRPARARRRPARGGGRRVLWGRPAERADDRMGAVPAHAPHPARAARPFLRRAAHPDAGHPSAGGGDSRPPPRAWRARSVRADHGDPRGSARAVPDAVRHGSRPHPRGGAEEARKRRSAHLSLNGLRTVLSKRQDPARSA